MRKTEVSPLFYLAIFITFLFLCTTITYMVNFQNNSISKDPGDWGALGDYLGGILNPLISIMTLFFVAKTYLTQKSELLRMKESAELSSQLQQESTTAQISLAQSYLKHIEISSRTARIQILSSKISSSYKTIEMFIHEMDRVTEAMNNNRAFIDMNGKRRHSDHEQKAYRESIGNKISAENKKIINYQNEIDSSL